MYRAFRPLVLVLLAPSCIGPAKTGPTAAPADGSAQKASVVIARQDMLETRAEGGIASFEDGDGPQGAGKSIRVTFAVKPPNFWDVEIAAHGLTVQPGPEYRLSFWAKADAPRAIFVDVSNDGAPWNELGFGQNIALTQEWKKYELPVRLHTIPANKARVCFKLGQSTAPVYLAAFQMEGPAGAEVAAAPPR